MGTSLSIAVPFLLLATVLQATVVPQIRLFSGGPDLIMLLVVCWAVNVDLDEGVSWAFVGGILQDLMSAMPTGTSSMTLVILVFAASAISRQVYGLTWLLLLILVTAGTILSQVIAMIVLVLTGFSVDPINTIIYVILPSIVYNVLFVLPVYGFIYRLQRALKRGRRFIA